MKKVSIVLAGVVLVGVGAVTAFLQMKSPVPATTSSEKLSEQYFSGSVAHVTGTSVAATAAQAHIMERLEAFRLRANEEVPALREHFGTEVPVGHYELGIEASVVESTGTETIVVSEYAYSGGANGMSMYATFTSPKKGGALLTLADVIAPNQHEAFTQLVRTHLGTWAKEHEGATLFPEDVAALTFDSFGSWSLSNDDLTIYFDKYAVGPGALGAITLSIPRTDLAGVLR